MRARLTVEMLEARQVLTNPASLNTILMTPVPEGTPLAKHLHAHLQVLMDGQAQVIPANIGEQPGGWLPVHTHDATGLIHVESTVVRDYSLQDWFTVWSLDPAGQAVVNRIHSAGHLLVAVNNQLSLLDSIVLHDDDQIAVWALSANPDAATTANEHWVRRVYNDLLHRDADEVGLVYFTSMLGQGESRAQAVTEIEQSAEYRNAVIEHLFVQYLHRDADSAGQQAFLAMLAHGATLDDVARAILASPEYYQRAGGGNAAYLSHLYSDVLGREIDSTGAAAWGQKLNSGESRASIADRILHSQEADTLLVRSLYESHLHRQADAAGLHAFVGALEAGGSAEAVRAGILGSGEYFSS